MRTLWRVLAYFKPYKWQMLVTLGIALAGTAAAMLPPWLTQVTVDEAIGGQRLGVLIWSVGGMAVGYSLQHFLNGVRIRWNNRLEQQVIYDMRTELYEHLQSLSLGFYANQSTGELMSRVVDDVNHVERVLLDGTEQVLVSLITLGGVATILFRLDVSLALWALLPIPFLMLGEVAYTRWMHRLYKAAREKSAEMSAVLHDNLAGLLQIKIFNRERHEARRFGGKADAYRRAELSVMYFWGAFSPATKFVTAMGAVIVLWAGGQEAIVNPASGMTVGKIFAFVGYLALFYGPIDRLSDLKNLWQQALAGGERVFELFDTRPAIMDPPHPIVPPAKSRGRVEFRQVSFQYDPRRPILEGIDLIVEPGESLAIVGPTGAGKTSLVNLIPRFYDVTSGAVWVDGRDVRDLSLAWLRQQVAVVSQEPFLFNDTIRENILYGKPEATEAEMIAAARSANIHPLIERLPDGYDTIVGERGVKLSVGEKQRISIARAILKDAPILILDEATASVDTITEGQIQEALDRLMSDRTTFLIAHRLSTVRQADRIAVIDERRIAELGSHAALLARGGLYAALYAAQAGREASEGPQTPMREDGSGALVGTR